MAASKSARNKKLKLNEIFYSVQGEGFWAGRPAVFIRFAGCNLKCSWCDTKYAKEVKFELTPEELVKVVSSIYATVKQPVKHIVFTGGEPTIQDAELMMQLIALLSMDCFIQVETNGTKYPEWLKAIDWITVSPKRNKKVVVPVMHELKLVYDNHTQAELDYYVDLALGAELYLQPLSNRKEEIEKVIRVIMQDNRWRLSLQLHKIIKVK